MQVPCNLIDGMGTGWFDGQEVLPLSVLDSQEAILRKREKTGVCQEPPLGCVKFQSATAMVQM